MKSILLLFLLVSMAWSADVHWTNTPNQWPYAVGDTVHLWGTFTNAISITNNSTTIYFESGANLTFSSNIVSVGLACADKTNVVIDGGVNGLIRWTDVGYSPMRYSNVAVVAVYTPRCTNLTVKNLTIDGVYVHTQGVGVLTADFGNAFQVDGGVNVTIQNNVITNAERACFMGQTIRNFAFTSNTVLSCCWMIGGAPAAGGFFTNLVVNGNVTSGQDAWYQPNLQYHCNGVYFYTDGNAGAWIRDVAIFNNSFGPEVGHNGGTASIFMSTAGAGVDGITNVAIFNNRFFADANGNTNPGFIWLYQQIQNVYYLNNTFLSISGANGLHFASQHVSSLEVILNNIICTFGTPISIANADWVGGQPITEDCNNFGIMLPGAGNFGESHSWNEWHVTFGREPNSNTNNPLFTSSSTYDFHIPAGTNTAASSTGTNLTTLVNSLGGWFTNALRDRDGRLRSTTAPWSMGEFEPNFVTEAAASATPAISLSGPQNWIGRVSLSRQ